MGFNSAFKVLKLLKTPGNGRLNNLNDPNRPQCVNCWNGYDGAYRIIISTEHLDQLNLYNKLLVGNKSTKECKTESK